jgi:Phage portal protein
VYFAPTAAYNKRYGVPDPRTGPQPPGRFSFGTQLQGGPKYSDGFNAKLSPNLNQLVENYGSLIYALAARNRTKTSSVPMRLIADGSRVMGKPARGCDPIKLSRSVGIRLAEQNMISSAAIDQVYEIRNHGLLDTLDNPDPYGTFTREKLIGLMVTMMDVVGSAYLVPEGNGWDWNDQSDRRKGPPDYLWVMYPHWVIPTRTSHSPIVDLFVYFSDRIPMESVVWFRNDYSLRDCYGSSYSPTNASESYRDQEQRMVAILSQVMGIGPRPSMIATAKDPMYAPGQKEAESFEIDLKRKQADGYSGSVLVNRGGWDFEIPDYPKADVGAKEIGEHDRNNMAAIFGQPATYYGTESNLANLQAADKQCWDNAIQPRCKTIAGQFTRLAKMCDQRLMFQHDHGLPEDEVAKQTVVDMQLKSGQATINEVNQDGKWGKKLYGDAPWLPGTLKQPDMIMEAHDQSLEQGQAVIDGQDLEGGLAVDQHEHGKAMDKKQLQSKEERALEDVQELTRAMRAQINAA